MADNELTQTEADALVALPKRRVDETVYLYPTGGQGIIIPLVSEDGHESFLFDLTRGRINLLKVTYQTRSRQVVVLARLDLGGPPHRNPDDEEIACPHLHIYREGYGDKWAIPVPINAFSNPDDVWQSLQDFMRFCHVTQPPQIERGLGL